MMPSFVPPALRALDLDLTQTQLTLLDRYLDLLLDANTRVNLTAVKQKDAAWHRLVLDSLTLAPGLEPLAAGGRVIDIGTGGGLPGIPLAITRPDLSFTLLDATGKKVRFLQETVAALELSNASPLQGRAETVGRDSPYRQKHQAAVTRAVGSVREVLEYGLPLVEVGGRMLIIKGASAEQELADASDALPQLGGGEVAVFDGYPEDAGVESDLVIISVLKEASTPLTYPRGPGVPRAAPL